MAIRKRSAGDSARPSIRDQHQIADVVNALPPAGKGPRGRRVMPFDRVRVHNGSGADRSQWDVLGVTGMTIAPSDNSQEWLDQRGVIEGVTPEWPTAPSAPTPSRGHIGNWVLCLEEIPEDKTGWAAIGGIVQCQITVNHLDHPLVDIRDDGGDGQLHTGYHGAGEILWREEETGDNKWAAIRIGPHDAPEIKGKTKTYGIAAGGSGDVHVWRRGIATSPEDAVTVHQNWMTGGAAIPSGRELLFRMFPDEGKYVVINAEC